MEEHRNDAQHIQAYHAVNAEIAQALAGQDSQRIRIVAGKLLPALAAVLSLSTNQKRYSKHKSLLDNHYQYSRNQERAETVLRIEHRNVLIFYWHGRRGLLPV